MRRNFQSVTKTCIFIALLGRKSVYYKLNMKNFITALKIIFFISFTGCVAVDEKNQGSEKSVISNIEKQLRKPPARKPPPDNMRLQDYAKYRNGQNAQRQNREVLVDNFIRGLGVDGF